MNTGIESLALSSKQIDFSIIVNEIFDLFNKVDNESEKYKILYCLNHSIQGIIKKKHKKIKLN